MSYTWVQKALQGAGLVAKRHKRGPHRRRRPRRPMPGMLLHIDGSKHRWLNDDRGYDLIVILDEATSEIYYAQLVEEESTRTVMAGLREVIEKQGLFCALYSDRVDRPDAWFPRRILRRRLIASSDSAAPAPSAAFANFPPLVLAREAI